VTEHGTGIGEEGMYQLVFAEDPCVKSGDRAATAIEEGVAAVAQPDQGLIVIEAL
jgi:hypothetical protein